MAIRRGTFGLVALGMAMILMASLGASAAPGLQTSASKTIAAGPTQQFTAAGGFLFDPIVKSGKFIAGEFECVAVGTQVKKVTMTRCYIVNALGMTYTTKAKSSAQGVVVVVKTVLNAPDVDMTLCLTAVANFKDGTSRTIHLASAPKGRPVLPCKLG